MDDALGKGNSQRWNKLEFENKQIVRLFLSRL